MAKVLGTAVGWRLKSSMGWRRGDWTEGEEGREKKEGERQSGLYQNERVTHLDRARCGGREGRRGGGQHHEAMRVRQPTWTSQ